jgi:hypothetical protein
MLDATDITLNGRGARLMRGAFALGALALVAVALSACAPSAERAAARAEQDRLRAEIAAYNIDRIDRATALMLKHCPTILSQEGIEPFLVRMAAKAAEIGPRVVPPIPDAKGYLIDGELLEVAVTPGIALRVEVRDLDAPLADSKAFKTAAAVDAPRLAHDCGAEIVLFDGGTLAVTQGQAAIIERAVGSGEPLAKAVGGDVSIAGSATWGVTPRIVSADRVYGILGTIFPDRGIAVAPTIFHEDINPVKVGDKLRYFISYRTGIYITSTLR